MNFDLRLWGKASRTHYAQSTWLHTFWYPANSGSQEYLVEYIDAPGQLYVTHRSTSRDNIVAGPFDSWEAAVVGYMIVTGRACI